MPNQKPIYYTDNERYGVYDQYRDNPRTEEQMAALRAQTDPQGTGFNTIVGGDRPVIAGTSSADQSKMSQEDWDAINSNTNRWHWLQDQINDARASGADMTVIQPMLDEQEALHKDSESRRARYGYSGGADGSQFITLARLNDGSSGGSGGGAIRTPVVMAGSGGSGSASYSQSPFVSKYQSQIDALTNALLNRGPFTYDALSDPAYLQYRESYTKAGQRGMQDTLGQISARTGGLASSYAGVAAQQTYDNYMSALADKIPELRQLAYQMYIDEGNTMRNNLAMLTGLDNTDYGRYSDDRDFRYGVYRDDVADQQWEKTFDYNASRASAADAQWQQNFNYNAQRDAVADARYQQELGASAAKDAAAKQETIAKLLYNAGDPSYYLDYLNATPEQKAAYVALTAPVYTPAYRYSPTPKGDDKPAGPSKVKSYDDLSQTGKAIANKITNTIDNVKGGSGYGNEDRALEAIYKSLDGASLSEAEMAYLLGMIGF